MADLRSAPFDKGNYFGLVATMLSKLYAQNKKRELFGSLFLFCVIEDVDMAVSRSSSIRSILDVCEELTNKLKDIDAPLSHKIVHASQQ